MAGIAAPDPSRSTSRWWATRAFNTARYSAMNFFIILGAATMALGGPWTWAGFAFSFFLLSYVDELLGDAGNAEEMPPVWYMQLMLYVTWPLLLLVTLVAFTVTSGGISWLDTALSWIGYDMEAARGRTSLLDAIGAFVSVGMFYGMAGVNVAHELVHRTDKPFDQLVGRWLLAFTWDTGFSIEHVYGHHRNVGTEADPATPRRGEYIMNFQTRSTIGQIKNAYRHERDRLKRRGIPNLPWNNRFWRGQAMTVCIIGLYCYFLGPIGVLAALLTGATGKTYLECVNYVEHYGLVRIPGTPVEARHSWDSYRRITTGMLYNLQLHANHHRNANRRYWELKQLHDEAPMLPMGYMPMVLVSFFPFIWRRIIDPLLVDWDTRLASPAEREYLTQKGILYGA
jgi:hypothetical protein